MATSFDLVVIGEDAPSLCAAGCAASAGATVALIRGAGKSQMYSPSISAIPNFVWRRLNLQDFGLKVEPVSSRVTLFDGQPAATTYQSVRDTVLGLRSEENTHAELWPSIVSEISDLGRDDEASGMGVLKFANQVNGLADYVWTHSDARSIIDDYMNGDSLSAHVGAHALDAYSFGGGEVGSGRAIVEFFNEHAWRIRIAQDSPEILPALRAACKKAGATIVNGDVIRAAADGAKNDLLTLSSETEQIEEKIRARTILFSTPDAAIKAGYSRLGSLGVPHNAVGATLRLRLRDLVDVNAGDHRSIFQIIDDGRDLQNARNAALDGRISDQLPVSFEFTDDGDILAHTNYLPQKIRDEDGWRSWSGQDRQVAEAAIIGRLAAHLPHLRENIRKREFRLIDYSEKKDVFTEAEHIVVQPRRHDAIAAAVMLADRIITDG